MTQQELNLLYVCVGLVDIKVGAKFAKNKGLDIGRCTGVNAYNVFDSAFDALSDMCVTELMSAAKVLSK